MDRGLIFQATRQNSLGHLKSKTNISFSEGQRIGTQSEITKQIDMTNGLVIHYSCDILI